MFFAHITYTSIPLAFETERLHAEKATEGHSHYLATILTDPEIQNTYNTTDQATFTNIPAQIAIIENQWEKYGFGLYIIFKKDTNEFIGFAGFHTVAIDDLGVVDCFTDSSSSFLELYTLFMPTHWRRGYGFECCTKLIELATKNLPYPSLIAYAEPTNIPSLQLLKKLNFRKVAHVSYNDKLHILYQLKFKKS